MKKIRKAIIPIAGNGTRFLPFTKTIPKEMLPILNKPTIEYIVNEAINSGIEEIIFITSSTKNTITDYFDRNFELERNLKLNGKEDLISKIKNPALGASFVWIRQHKAKGLGHAVLLAKNLIEENEPFALLLGDDVIYTEEKYPALKELINVYEETNLPVIGVQEVSDNNISKYGVIGPGKKINNNTWEISSIIEKPSLKDAPSNLGVVGRYILNSEIFEHLSKKTIDKFSNEIQITDSIMDLVRTKGVVATKLSGTRYDMGSIIGFVKAQLEYSLRDESLKNEVLEMMKDSLDKYFEK